MDQQGLLEKPSGRRTTDFFADENYRMSIQTGQLFFKRWIILILYLLTYVSDLWIQLTFGTVATKFTKYYDVSDFSINSLTLVFFIVEIPLIIPCAYWLQRYGLRFGISVGVILQFLGAWIRYIGAAPDRFYVLLVGQTIVAIAQPFLDAAPTKLTGAWFGTDERTTAIGLYSVTNALVISLTFAGTSFVLHHISISELFLIQAICTSVITALVLIFFEEKPPAPPTPSSYGKRVASISKSLVEIWSVKGILLLGFSFSLSLGFMQSFFAIWEEIASRYSYSSSESGISASILCITGIVGAITLSYLVDRTKMYKGISLGIATATSFSILTVAAYVVFGFGNPILLYIICAIFGFWAWSVSGIYMEIAAVICYPIPEEVTIAVLLIFADVTSVSSGYLLTWLLSYGAGLAIWVFAGLLALQPLFMLFFKAEYKKDEYDKGNRRVIQDIRNPEEE